MPGFWPEVGAAALERPGLVIGALSFPHEPFMSVAPARSSYFSGPFLHVRKKVRLIRAEAGVSDES
jgi:hypothetical protein